MIVELQTNYGKMFVPDNDAGQYWWLANIGASVEDEFIDEVCALLDERPKGCAVDVGANFGAWTLPLARHAHSVVAIEPQRCCFDLLTRSIAENKLHSVRALNIAAGAENGVTVIPQLDINQAANFGGVGLTIAHPEQPDAPVERVPMRKLDDVLNGEQVSFIKVDVEGCEEQVIVGSCRTIARCKPILFVEMDHPRTNKAVLREMIESFGYVTDMRWGNYLALPL